MPKQSQRAEVNTFVGGLITEASPLNFPSNASADEQNFELNRDGSRYRRLGMDFETDAEFAGVGFTVEQAQVGGFSTFKWNAAAGDPNSNFVVFQVCNTLHFYNIDQNPITKGGIVGDMIIDQFPTSVPFSFANVDGFLIVASGVEVLAVVSYVPTTKVFSFTYQRLLVRDVWGVEETTNPQYEQDPSYRGPATAQHGYNLQNQSWGIPRKGKNGVLQNPQLYYNGDLGVYPSNSEQVWAGLQFQPVSIGQDPFERIYTNLYEEALGEAPKAAKGYFVIDALRRGQGRLDAMAVNTAKYPIMSISYSPPQDYTPYGASCVAEFAGRVFYSGFRGEVINGDARSPNFGNYVFFSRLVKNQTDINKCYQEGDPTSKDSSDLLDTDGGFIKVSGAQNILSIRSLGLSLVVIAENGVWAITGGTTDSGFSATNYKSNKISSFGGLSDSSVIVEGATAFYWANDGIYTIARNQVGDLEVENITLPKIQKLYQAIPNLSKIGAFGAYDEVNKKIRWIYKQGTLFEDDSVTYELILDSALSAFTRNRIYQAPGNIAEIMGSFQTQLFVPSASTENVVSTADDVFADIDQVIVSTTGNASNVQFLRYFTLVKLANGTTSISVSLYHDSTWADWKSVDGIGTDAKAYCLTGSVTGGDSAAKKQIPYLVMSFIRTETGVDANFQPVNASSCMFRMQWNFANAVQSNKWTPLRQAYRYVKFRISESIFDTFDTGFEVIQTKDKVRGSGKAFALYFETEPAKDCKVLGWNLTVNANQST